MKGKTIKLINVNKNSKKKQKIVENFKLKNEKGKEKKAERFKEFLPEVKKPQTILDVDQRSN